ncbi:hypothetical protein OC834_004670 [Tilletia horrida]|uniref:Uncharacterized protein n=1 Tax=Tilletia horrida TaxID=155126 RepID=A0AAN6JT87_9BASI|nr:hypothetical protein OC835_005419 [Tilletia horrida]KAK0526795.1 hypothetical protein OC834_004670 [Tilletia horrida]KAK0538191.1 hypothetical protein OC842_001373 [Tilletia horrida]KAK0562893.1 hypothetical protein OC844_002474 [Tilletia horrida]
MAIAGTVLGYAGLGFVTRCYALGIQRRNIFENFGGHAILMGLFGAAGYWLHGVQERQVEIIDAKKREIKAARERMASLGGPRASKKEEVEEA